MEVVLDTNFIVSCLKNKIDFVGQLKSEGFRILVPKEVIEEMKDIRQKVSHDDRIAIDLAFELLEKSKIEKMKLPKGKVDDGLISLGKKGMYIATLDNSIKKIVPNSVGISSSKSSILIDRQ